MIEKSLPLFYRELLELYYFQELTTYSKDNKSELILWNNGKTTIEKNCCLMRELILDVIDLGSY